MEFIFGLIFLYLICKALGKLIFAFRLEFHKRKYRRLREVEHEERLKRERLEREARDKPISDELVSFKCIGHPNRTLALRYGVMNTEDDSENNTIRLLKKGYVPGFEERGHYYAELYDYENTKVRVVIDEGSDYINTFYPLSDKEWFEKYETLEKLLKNNDSFTLKELAKYHIDVVVIPGLKAS